MYPAVKWVLDLILALLLCLLLAPFAIIVSIILLIDSGRPLFFFQERVGKNGKLFTLYKFRTLDGNPHALENPSAYATPFCLFLRQWGIDEWPQLLNILRGEMSLVGPRPALPHQVALYGENEKRRLHVRPGLTGLAQIKGRNLLTWPERIRYDIAYVNNTSFLLDLSILMRTPLLLISGTGIHGPDGKNKDFVAMDATHEQAPPSLRR